MCVVCVCVSGSTSVSVCGDTVTLVVWAQSPAMADFSFDRTFTLALNILGEKLA